MRTIPFRAARAMAEWWGRQIGGGGMDAAADSPQMALAQADGQKLADRHRPAQGQIAAFVSELTQVFAALPTWTSIYCDYDPCEPLAAAAMACGIDLRVFPWKSGSGIDSSTGRVWAQRGYGGEREDLGPADDAPNGDAVEERC